MKPRGTRKQNMTDETIEVFDIQKMFEAAMSMEVDCECGGKAPVTRIESVVRCENENGHNRCFKVTIEAIEEPSHVMGQILRH
jgi:hypothetical protein